MMNCSRDLIEAYIDEELDPGLSASLEEHLSGCPSCSEVYTRFREQRTNISSAAPYYTAPVELQRSVRDALRQATANETKAAANQVPWRWLAIAASILLAISVSWNLRPSQRRTAQNDLIAQNILSDHIRSLIGTHLLDVPSTDQHTVKPWFAGKVDFSPPVKDVAGFPLLGGRLEYFEGHSAAALIYGRRAHIINLFVWPSAATPEASQTRNGYHLRSWSSGGMTFWAVSDVNDGELAQFESLYRQN
jgi:anti-sigma factor RsiW